MPVRLRPTGCRRNLCGRRATRQGWVKSQYVCPNCGVHLAIGAYYRLSTVLDHGTFKELNPDIAPNDVLHFPDYQEKLAAASVKTGLKEAAVTAIGRIGGVQAVVAVLDSRFFMGSMSTAVGEKSHVRLSMLPTSTCRSLFFLPVAAHGCRRAFSA